MANGGAGGGGARGCGGRAGRGRLPRGLPHRAQTKGNPGWGSLLVQPATHTHTFGPRLGQSLWIVVNLSLDQPMIRRFMWADDARGGVRQLLLHSAANGQVEQLRVLAFCALTSLAGDVENSGPMWRDGATRAATVRAAASPGPGPGSRPSPHSDCNQVSAAANSQPEPVRVQALRTLASLACDGANKKSMWMPSSELGAREVCCCVTTCTQPPTLHASQLQPQVLVPSSPLHNLHAHAHVHAHAHALLCMCPGAPRRCQRARDPWRCSAAGQASTRIPGYFGGGAAQSCGRAPFFGGGSFR